MTVVTTASDTHVREGAAAKNFGTSVELSLNGAGGGNDRRAFLHFTRPFPLDATIVSAKLRIYTRAAWTGSQNVTARRVTESWAEARATWANQPTKSDTNAATVAANSLAAGVLIELDVTAMMQDVANGSPYYGIRLELSASVNRLLHSSEAVNAALRPVLEVDWTLPPDAPTSLAPGGGRAVSVQKPVLAWTFTDPGGSEEQASSQVQVDDAADFATPLYDSGKLANALPSWDLAATAFAGLAFADVRFWRVRVWDGTDLVSEWSDPVSFTRIAKGTLTIVSPPDGGTVDDLTPPVDWTFAGATQEAYRVELYELLASGAAHLAWTSGRVTSTDTVLTLPTGQLATGGSFRVLVRVWDDEDREAIWGDTDYVDETADFTYARSGAPAAVTALSATPNDAAVDLAWTRSVQPDYFSLRVDGVEVLPRIEPADVFVSGTSYAMKWWGATPRVEHTYEVEAVVDSAGALQHSDGNATDTAQTNPTGLWLIDTDDDTAVRLGGQERADFRIGEEGTTHAVRGSRVKVRITETVRGYEGSFSGNLRGKAARDTFLALKGRLKPVRLIVSDLNMLVELEEVASPPTPLSGDRLYGADFGFFQVDDFTFDVLGG